MNRREALATLGAALLPSAAKPTAPQARRRRVFRQETVTANQVAELGMTQGFTYWQEIDWEQMRPGDKVLLVAWDQENGCLYEIQAATVAETTTERAADGTRQVFVEEVQPILGALPAPYGITEEDARLRAAS